MFRLDGKAALVTGASGGIGAAIARALHAQGANVVLSGTRRDALEALAMQLGERAHVCPADLRDASEPDALIETAEKAAGPLHILVNNAGMTRDMLALRMSDRGLAGGAGRRSCRRRSGWRARCCAACCGGGPGGSSISPPSSAPPAMPARPTMPPPRPGLVGMTKALAQEVASRGITINVVAPGFVVTADDRCAGRSADDQADRSDSAASGSGSPRTSPPPSSIWRRMRLGGSPAPHCT